MDKLAAMVLMTGAVPLAVAWRSSRGSTIRHALAWAGLAWLAWIGAALAPGTLTTYAALTLTGGAGVAVLGARRPVVGAWNFIVASLLVVFWMAWAEGLLAGSALKLETFRWTFLAVLLGITVVNYLPTRLGFGAAALGIACGIALVRLRWELPMPAWMDPLAAGLAPWLAWLGGRRPRGADLDGAWRRFRDRFGMVWASRLREQLNATAKNSGWPVELGWRGTVGAAPAEALAALLALQKRFGTE